MNIEWMLTVEVTERLEVLRYQLRLVTDIDHR